MHRETGKSGDIARIKSRIWADKDCAWSEGGPVLCFGFERGDNMTLGTLHKRETHKERNTYISVSRFLSAGYA